MGRPASSAQEDRCAEASQRRAAKNTSSPIGPNIIVANRIGDNLYPASGVWFTIHRATNVSKQR